MEQHPVDNDVVLVVVPDDSNTYGKLNFFWVLQEILAKNVKKLAIICFHYNNHISHEEVEKDLDEYVFICKLLKVSSRPLVIHSENEEHAADTLAAMIRRHGFRKLVMPGAEDKCYPENLKSPKSEMAKTLMEKAPPTCEIWLTCKGHLIYTRYAESSEQGVSDGCNLAGSFTTVKETAGMEDLIKFLNGSPDTEICDVQLRKEAHERSIMSITPFLKMAEILKNDYELKLREVTLKISELKNNLDFLKKGHGKSPKRTGERGTKKKSYKFDLNNAENEKTRLTEQKEDVKLVEERLIRSGYFLQEPEAAVTDEAGGLYEKNDQQKNAMMTLPAETVNTEFSEDEIEESINCLGSTLIGNGASGSTHKGLLRNTTVVAIKKLHPESMQGESDFIQKVAVLGRVRHPNIVTLIGVCTRIFGLVYEFLPGGSLQDRLQCRNEMPPLKWQVRIKIMREICRVLIFLHSNKPQPVVHGNLKPSKVILDSNLACKLQAFDISQSNGKATTTQHDDVYSFGLIVLQLLTGLLLPLHPAQNIIKVVEEAMQNGNLDTVLDTTAGRWPTKLANLLANIGLRCVKMSREERLDLLLVDVWKELVSHENEYDGPPEYLICPISKDVMENPYCAADGHTYEYEEILKWIHQDRSDIRQEKVLSPMTGKELKHSDLIPNFALRSGIQEWQEKHPGVRREAAAEASDPHPVHVVPSSEGHPITPPEEAQLQSPPPPPTGQPAQVSSSPPYTVIPSLTDDVGSSSRSPNTALPPPASSSPPYTDARSRSTTPVNNTSAATAARSHRLNPVQPANPIVAPPPPPRRSPSSTDFLPPPTGIRRRHVNGRLPSSSDVPGPSETSRVRGKFKHE